MLSVRVLVPLFIMLSAWLPAGAGENPDYIFDLSEGGGDRFSSVTLTLSFTNDGSDIEGYSFGICHDDDQLELGSGDVANGDEVNGSDFYFHVVQIYSTGWTVGALLDFEHDAVISAGDDLEMYLATYELVGTGNAQVEFCTTLGTPDVLNQVLAGGSDIDATVFGGEIDIYDPNAPFTFRAESKTIFYNADDGVDETTIALSIEENSDNFPFPTETRGFAMGLEHDPDVLTPTGVTPIGELVTMRGGLGADFIGVNLEPALGAGLTIGVIYEFEGDATIEFDSEKTVAEIAYDVNSSLLIGNTHGLVTQLIWNDDLADPPVVNNVFVGSEQITGLNVVGGFVIFDVPGEDEPLFVRGDVNGNGVAFALGDAIALLNWGFVGGAVPPCMDAADVNDNGSVSALTDSLYLLAYAFTGGPAPPSPGATSCGPDPTSDATGCLSPPAACN